MCAHKWNLKIIFTTGVFLCTLLKNDFRDLIKEKYFLLISEVSCSKLAGNSCLRFHFYVNSVSPKCYRINMVQNMFKSYMMDILLISFIMKVFISPLIKRYLQFPKKFYKTLRWLTVFVTSHETSSEWCI